MHRLEDAPSLANLKAGDWICAAVDKRLATGAIVRILNAVRTAEPKYPADKRDSFWNPGSP